ncbi:MAG TPA: C45 family autoproteolytic acyltransferase/hydrolase [Thermoanaerobaculaceae bacterium]|nr:C45 family autoproteolytic acyltransferase/hydrolase [Thermoanaerobaculaceae bacterium]HRS15254.1 C45 family autoproteolytic acyltransferase/hydrolase [Thermoanaerobaculaceae bacterium]
MKRLIGLAALGVAMGTAGAGSPGPGNAGFEQGLEGWELLAKGRPAAARVAVDTTVAHGGSGSLRLECAAACEATVASAPLRLEVGRPYRLRGVIRTRAAVADPLSRYPTAVPATLSMASFPFTNHAPAVGADADWTAVETVFIATRGEDRVQLHLGRNGTATGTVWFDDLAVEEVIDIAALVAPETVRWQGEGFRYDDRGWIMLHVEGAPHARGFQHGSLVADEIVAYISKLAIQENGKEPAAGWASLRSRADLLFLRGFDAEQLEEMKGIADGAARAGARYDGRALDLLDIVTLNSIIDLDYAASGIKVTPHALSGRSFLAAAEEMDIPDTRHKCSAIAATGPATADGGVVFGQIFMWGGYTGVHFNVLCDLVPTTGQRLVYHTFPGGIHSGTDFYLNDAGIVFGETTVAQTPFEISGTPQSSRARRAAQYARSIDDVVRILSERNNGLYTNDWPIADLGTGETAVFLLGTKRSKLWRSSDRPAPFGTPGFLWANNNARDDGVRREYAVQPDDAPFDLAFGAWNRDIAFREFYHRYKGKIDAENTLELLASSPVNRPHACDGKLTTTEMGRRMVFLAHHGKTTLREKIPGTSRRMPDLPGAVPHLALGWAPQSPVVVAHMLRAARRAPAGAPAEPALVLEHTSDRYRVDRARLWRQSVFPASDRDNWLTSASAAYWRMLRDLPDRPEKAFARLSNQLAELGNRYLYVVSREPDLAPVKAERSYERYGTYQIPRIKGTFALHQLRLALGTDTFLAAMRAAHERFGNRPASTAAFLEALSAGAGRDVSGIVRPWIEREGLPDPKVSARIEPAGAQWVVKLEVRQEGTPWRLWGAVAIDTGGQRRLEAVELAGPLTAVEWRVKDRPTRVLFNAGRDFPVPDTRYFAWSSFADDFSRTLVVWGTARQVEANHTTALRFQTTLADAFSEVLPPVVKDAELTAEQAARHDLVALGELRDNALLQRLAAALPAELGHGFFRFRGRTYGHPDDGLYLVVPNPYNPKRTLYLVAANSAIQLWRMTKAYQPTLPNWAIARGDEIQEQGFFDPERFAFELAEQ